MFKIAAGIGIFIPNNRVEWLYSKAIGANSILFAEQFALAQIPTILREINIPLRNKREMICVHNEIACKEVYTNHKIPTCPNLAKQRQQLLFDNKLMNVIVVKVKSHLDEPVAGNEVADELAAKGRMGAQLYTQEFKNDVLCLDKSSQSPSSSQNQIRNDNQNHNRAQNRNQNDKFIPSSQQVPSVQETQIKDDMSIQNSMVNKEQVVVDLISDKETESEQEPEPQVHQPYVGSLSLSGIPSQLQENENDQNSEDQTEKNDEAFMK